MQSSYFWWSVVFVYLGIAALAIDLCLEPWFEEQPVWAQWVEIYLIVGVIIAFSGGVVFVGAPLDVQAYSPPGEYTSGVKIGGIAWDVHFRDLRVSISNPSSDGYQQMDMAILPDKTVYKAAILEGVECELSPIGGASQFVVENPKTSTHHTFTGIRSGDTIDPYDSMGNVWIPFAYESGYRLRCQYFPPHSTIKIVFALIQLKPDMPLEKPPKYGPPGGFAFSVNALKGVTNSIDLLDTKPQTQTTGINGKYIRAMKPHSLKEALDVMVY